MKKILAVLLGVMVLATGLTACKPKEEPDPHEGLYGKYTLVSFENRGQRVRDQIIEIALEKLPSDKVANNFPEDADKINSFIIDLKSKIGDTITITKKKIVFSNGDIVIEELNYNISGSSYINIHNQSTSFPIGSFRFDTFNDPPIYQLEISEGMYFSPEPNNGLPWKPDYSVYFFYLK